MNQYHFDPLNRFVIDDYDAAPPFASFLPGIAGPLGIPLWAFYVNRGQAIASFGVDSKDMPIMEFQPANKAYQTVPYTGFRTFIKVATPRSDSTSRFGLRTAGADPPDVHRPQRAGAGGNQHAARPAGQRPLLHAAREKRSPGWSAR